MPASDRHNADVRRAWDTNAEFWDEQMGEGNDFFHLLIWSAVERLLALPAGGPILDVACGNGLTSRRLASLGEAVVGIDVSERMIALARSRGGEGIDYRVVDATDRVALLAECTTSRRDAGVTTRQTLRGRKAPPSEGRVLARRSCCGWSRAW